MKLFFHLGRYFLLIKRVFSKPEKLSVYTKQILYEIDKIGISSLPIIAIISFFMGGVITIQSAFGFTSPLVPLYAVGFTVRESMLSEFCPTIVSLILAGKIGSNIASEIGSMRITEQIDALEIMGINSAGYLILPKIVAGVVILPFLIAISMFLGIVGGYIMGLAVGAVTSYEYIFGIQAFFEPWKLYYSFTKVITFAFLITSISSYFGFYTEGGALEVGKSSTSAVVYSSILILIFNFLITQLFYT
ncbi:MAG: ABC transporter permease [Bacteroidia bacterium]|nr:ABC transporter permease [Bacteroidia bacterium]